MKRSGFLKTLGALSTAPLVSVASAASQKPGSASARANCVLVPAETPGPFPLDLTDNAFFFRQDIREDRVGVQLRQRVRIVGTENCEPMPNVRVHIWHCDNAGGYSGYNSEEGLTYCRGYQITDENGECEFITIVPGWYPGRVTHVHFQVYVSSAYSAVSQWTWPHDETVAAVAAHPELYPEGPDPLSPSQDGVFADGFDLQMATLEWDEAAGEYVSEYEATVEGAGTSGVGYHEMRSAQVMALGQNYPNPCRTETTFPLELHQPAQVSLSLWDLNGRCVHRLECGKWPVGRHSLPLDLTAMNLSSGTYAFQVEAQADAYKAVDVRQISFQDY
jgi:protocatechuate 3,4-dioxygenase beta subunit